MILRAEVRRCEANEIAVQAVEEGDDPGDHHQADEEAAQLLAFDDLRDIDNLGVSHFLRWPIATSRYLRCAATVLRYQTDTDGRGGWPCAAPPRDARQRSANRPGSDQSCGASESALILRHRSAPLDGCGVGNISCAVKSRVGFSCAGCSKFSSPRAVFSGGFFFSADMETPVRNTRAERKRSATSAIRRIHGT